jgi:hypothetical protein
MSESVILCEGFHDRAFWDGWLTLLKCDSAGFRPGTSGYPQNDPWGDPVRQGQFAYRSLVLHGRLVRTIWLRGVLFESLEGSSSGERTGIEVAFVGGLANCRDTGQLMLKLLRSFALSKLPALTIWRRSWQL